MDDKRYYAALAVKELPKGVDRLLESISETLAKRGFVLRTFGKGDLRSGSEPFERGTGTLVDHDEAAEVVRKTYADTHCNEWVEKYGISGKFRTRDFAVNIFSRLVGETSEQSVSFVLLWLDEDTEDPAKDLGRMVRTASEGLGFHTVDLGTLYRESLSLDEFKSVVAPAMLKACDARAPQALASPFRGDARAPQALASPFRGDARVSQTLVSPPEDDARVPQALASPPEDDAPQTSVSRGETTPSDEGDSVPTSAETPEAKPGRRIPDELREKLEGENARAGAEQFMNGLEQSLSEEPPESDIPDFPF